MRVAPTTSKGDPVGRLMMLNKPLSPSLRCDELDHPRATVRPNGSQWIVAIWDAPFVLSQTDGAVTNHASREDAVAWARMKVQTERLAAGQILYPAEVLRAAAA